ncbi:glycosyltransferase [[Eubacterium] cellulosolvens]
MQFLSEFILIIILFVGFFLLSGSIFYIITVWNVRKPKFEYDFFPKVSLMAYAWQSGNIIERKIKNFLEQDYPKDKLEIIIYDNESTDETENICLRYKNQGLIKYYRAPEPYDRKAPVLDHAIGEMAKGEIIALTDPDGVCERNWLKNMVQPFKNTKVGAAVGITHCGNYYVNVFTKLRAIEDEWWYNISVLGKNGRIKISSFQPICGANYALRKEAWESVGRSHGKSLIEDYEMTLRLYQKGWKIECSNANVWQEEVENIGEYILQRRRWFQSPIKEIIKGKRKVDKILGALPISMQTTAFLSLIYFIITSTYLMLTEQFKSVSLISALPLMGIYFSLAFGLLKVNKRNLLPYIPILLTFDSVLQIIIFIEAKLKIREERHWVKLAKGEYYHIGREMHVY